MKDSFSLPFHLFMNPAGYAKIDEVVNYKFIGNRIKIVRKAVLFSVSVMKMPGLYGFVTVQAGF